MSKHKQYVQQARARRKLTARPKALIERTPAGKLWRAGAHKDAPGSARVFSYFDCPQGEPCQLWPSVFLDETDSIARIERRSEILKRNETID